MPAGDVDFNIQIRTLADLTGIKLTQQQFDALKVSAIQGNQQAINALSQLTAAQRQAQGAVSTGFTGSAVGIGTIVTLVTGAIHKWQQFNDELDKQAEGMIKAEEKSRALGLSVVDMMDAMKSAERIETEPLQQSFDRLKQRVIGLKTEMQLAFEAGLYEDAKKAAAALGVVESQLNRVTSAIKQQSDEADRAAKKREQAAEKEREAQESFIGGAVKTSDTQVQRALQQADAARKAEAAGDSRSAAQFQKSSEAFQRGFTPAQSDQFAQLKTAMEKMNTTLDMILQQFR